MKKYYYLAAMLLLLILFPSWHDVFKQNAPEKRMALLIGNKDYQSVSDLDNPINDINAIERKILSLGFERNDIHKKSNLELKSVEIAVLKFTKAITTAINDGYKVTALIYYSGHGVGDGENTYIVPTEFEVVPKEDISAKAYSLQRLEQKLIAAGSTTNIILFDGCRTSPNERRDVFESSVVVQKPSSGTFYGFASEPGTPANDRKGTTNSPFAEALVKYLDLENQEIRVTFGVIREYVETNTNKLQVPRMEEKLQGQFYFNFVEKQDPMKDSDGDLIPDIIDECDYEKGEMRYNGCPDSDKDGVPDHKDDCPNTYGTNSNGCTTIITPKNNDRNQPNMIFVEGGTFKMGSNDYDDEKPIHNVTVRDFYIGKHEVTVKEYFMFCTATNSNFPEWLEKNNAYNVETGTNDYYKTKGYSRTGSDDLPIVGVSWDNAKAYCQWLSSTTGQKYRLPTEAEWEYAARGGNQSKNYTYSGSNNIDEVAWYSSNSSSTTHTVGTKKANELGIHDMSGNVWEWCEDKRHGNYENAPTNGTAWLQNGENSRVQRGGSWAYRDFNCRVTERATADPARCSVDEGFRVIRGD